MANGTSNSRGAEVDRPSTLGDLGTRSTYSRTHDEASHSYPACSPESLLVPVAERERAMGVLFGEHRMRYAFGDQLAAVRFPARFPDSWVTGAAPPSAAR